MIKNNRILSSICIVLMFCIATIVKAESLVATVDRNVISIADTFILNLEAKDLGSLNQPDFSILEADFEIISKNVSHNIQNINGVSSQSAVWQLQLQAKKLGEVEIPAFDMEGVSSQSISLQVKEVIVESANNLDFKLQLNANKEQLKENEQVLISLKFYFSKYVNNLQNTEIELDNAKVTRLKDKQYETQIQGKTYGVFEISYVVFPSTKGLLDIPAQQVSVRMGRNSLFNARQGKTITLRSNALQIPVSSLQGTSNVIVADDLVLTENWPTDLQSVEVGDSLTREISLKINGALAETVPAIAMNEIQGVKIYPEAANKDEKKTVNGVFIQRSRKFAIVPIQAGSLELPAIEYQWWNAREQKLQTASLPARKIHVIEASDSAESNLINRVEVQIETENKKAQAPDTQPVKTKLEKVYVESPVNDWLIISNIFSVLVITLLSLLLFLRRKKEDEQPAQKPLQNIDQEKQLFDQLLVACENENCAHIYQQLQRWSNGLDRDQWSLPSFKVQADNLQQALFANQSTDYVWSKEQFVKLLHEERKQWLADQKNDGKSTQRHFELYPDRALRS